VPSLPFGEVLVEEIGVTSLVSLVRLECGPTRARLGSFLGDIIGYQPLRWLCQARLGSGWSCQGSESVSPAL
jgi:hypothetical protein